MRREIVLAGVSMLGCAGALALGTTPGAVDWKALLPAVQYEVRKAFPNGAEHYGVTVSRTDDVTGMGTTEALIDLGCCGAYTHEMTVMRVEDGRPVLALFQGKDGKVSPMLFLDGASVMHGAAVQMLPANHAVFSATWNMNGDGTMHDCGGEAYRWEAPTKVFTFNRGLSGKLSREFCRRIDAELSELMKH